MSKTLKILLFLLFYPANASCLPSPVVIPSYQTQLFDQEIHFIHGRILPQCHSLVERIEDVSKYFVGRHYLNGALGEGIESQIDQSPLYRTDAFDCMTYVSTVLALAKSNQQEAFINELKKIQYRDSQVSYFNRYHFTELEWNVSNTKLHNLVDITTQICPNYKIAYANINKPNWYRQHTLTNIKCCHQISEQTAQKLLHSFYEHAAEEKLSLARTTYVPLTNLFTVENNQLIANQFIFERIPSGAIVEIVDKTIPFKERIGTDLNVAHLGFAIKNKNYLIFRHASKIGMQVMDVSLIGYLARYYQLTREPEKIGIHVLKVL